MRSEVVNSAKWARHFEGFKLRPFNDNLSLTKLSNVFPHHSNHIT